MDKTIIEALGNDKVTMVELLARIGEAEYRKEYSQKITTMANEGDILRTWDKSGMAFYQLQKKYSVSLSAVPNPDYDSMDERSSIELPEQWVSCDSFGEASAIVSKYIEFHNLGSGNFDGGVILSFDNKYGISTGTNVIIARVSYNGRIWEAKFSPKANDIYGPEILKEEDGSAINSSILTDFDPEVYLMILLDQ